MKIQIMGAGALGSLFGYFIQKAGFDVLFVSRGEQLKALRKGLRISGIENDVIKVKVVSKPENADVTFVAVKAYDTERVSKQLSKVDCGIACSLQNGIGNEEILSKYIENVVGGITTYGANLKEYGHVVFAGEGITHIGEYKGDGVDEVFEVLNNSKINVEIVEDIKEKIWEKTVINSAINPITALFRVENGMIVRNPHLWSIAKRTALESEKVAESIGYFFDAVKVVREVAIKTAKNKSSMLQDVEAGRRTEIDFINGVIVKIGEKKGIDVCYNRFLWKAVKAIESI